MNKQTNNISAIGKGASIAPSPKVVKRDDDKLESDEYRQYILLPCILNETLIAEVERLRQWMFSSDIDYKKLNRLMAESIRSYQSRMSQHLTDEILGFIKIEHKRLWKTLKPRLERIYLSIKNDFFKAKDGITDVDVAVRAETCVILSMVVASIDRRYYGLVAQAGGYPSLYQEEPMIGQMRDCCYKVIAKTVVGEQDIQLNTSSITSLVNDIMHFCESFKIRGKDEDYK